MKLKITAVAVALPILLLWLNFAISLLDVANDAAVLGGYFLIVLWMAAVVVGVHCLFRVTPKAMAIFAGGVFLMVSTSGCNVVIPPGKVGILVKQTGSERGVQDYPLQTGRVYYNPWNENVLEYPTSVQRAIWTRSENEGHAVNEEISFQSREGLTFTGDVNISYELVREMVPHFYVRFRNDDIDAFTHGFLRDAVRNSFKVSTEYAAEDINGSKQGELIDRVKDGTNAIVKQLGINIIQLGFAAPPRPPDQVKNAIEQKIAATQNAERVENERRQAVAEGAKRVALAQAEAQANDALSKSITPTLVQWEQLQVMKSRWNGSFPQVMGASGNLLYSLGGIGGK